MIQDLIADLGQLLVDIAGSSMDEATLKVTLEKAQSDALTALHVLSDIRDAIEGELT